MRNDSELGKIGDVRRFRRWLFNGLTALSLLLCIAASVLWDRNGLHGDTLRWQLAAELPNAKNTAPIGVAKVEGVRKAVGWSEIYWSDAILAGVDEGRLAWGRDTEYWPRNEPGLSYIDMPPNDRRLHFRGWEQHRWGVTIKSFHFAGMSWWIASVPIWPIVVLCALLPGWRLTFSISAIGRQIVRGRQCKAGHCAKCGYDLRATPERCPECGTVVSPKVET